MKCRLVKIESLSGRKASVYSVSLGYEKETLFEIFVRENRNSFLSETKDILKRLRTIGHKTGLSEQITQRIKDKEITFENDYLDFTGNLEFHDYGEQDYEE